MGDVAPLVPFIAGQTLTYEQTEQARTITVGTPAWYTWLQTATMFTFKSDHGTFTARRERSGNKRGGWYWRAYQEHAGQHRRLYIGRSAEITPDRLNDIAALLAGDDDVKRTRARAGHAPRERAVGQERRSHSPTDGSLRHAEGGHHNEVAHPASGAIPWPLTSLVGRDGEVDAICGLLARPDVRELTLTGTGGVGKTRLALAVAARLRDAFPDGVCCVSLASLHEADAVLPAIAQAEGLQGVSDRSSIELLQTVLREQSHLLVLDNFEQVIAAAPSLVSMLASCPNLKILVTSREALRVRGEREFDVQPLALPDPNRLPDGEALAHYGAVALFMERAREVQPDLQLTGRAAPLITEICRRLDGLPLAIELAAARLKVLSLEALLERLEHRLQVLTGGPRDLPARQQTVRQTIAWSYDLLSEEEQRLFRLLSIFLNGCTLEAVEALYSACGGQRARVLDTLTSLLDKHLLRRGETGGGLGKSTPRLLMHETLREYGLGALAANQELECARQAHAEYYLGLAQSYLESAKRVAELLGRLEWEHANLHEALEWALERPANEIAMRLETTVFAFWEGQQRLGEGRTVAHGSSVSSRLGPTQMPDNTPATPGAPAVKSGDEKQGATPDQGTAGVRGGFGAARHVAVALYLLGLIAWIIGDFSAARRYADEGVARARDADERVTLAYLTDLKGQIALDQGEDGRAQALLEEGFALHQQAGDILGGLNTLYFLERALLVQGNASQARERAEQHLALSRAIGFPSGVVGALAFLGRLALEEGNANTARELFEESLPILRELGDNLSLAVATNLQGIGVTLARRGQLLNAVRLWSAAEALCPILPEERALVTRSLVAVRPKLGEEAFAAAWAEGQTMTVEQALAEVGHAATPSASLARPHGSAGKAHPRRHFIQDLTEREGEVLRLVARGLTDAQIADALVISPRTVNAHLRSIYTKLNISSRNAATYFALEHGLL